MANGIEIVVVDDHRLFRDGLVRLLTSAGRFDVVGEASSGEEFLEIMGRFWGSGASAGADSDSSGAGAVAGSGSGAGADSDVGARNLPIVFMDIDMPGGMNGIEAARRALERTPELRIIVLSMHGEQEYYLAMVELGVKGFLLKNSDFAEVATAAETVAAGGTYFSPEILSSLVSALKNSGEPPKGEALSEREAEILPLICEGFSNGQIADRLFISKRTVDKHRANILAKTGSKNTASLVIYAVRHKLITVND